MPRIVDLTTPIEDHFRWPVEHRLLSDHGGEKPFRVSWYGWVMHGFTHVDAQCHYVPGAPSIEATPLAKLVGEAAIVDLHGIPGDTPVTAEMLEEKGGHVRDGDIVILAAQWETRRDLHTPEFWTTAPYVTDDACAWLMDRNVRTAGFDFPQDYCIRKLLHGESSPFEDNTTHYHLLRHGVTLVEYLRNLGQIPTPRAQIAILPLLILGSDGAPARAVAWVD